MSAVRALASALREKSARLEVVETRRLYGCMGGVCTRVWRTDVLLCVFQLLRRNRFFFLYVCEYFACMYVWKPCACLAPLEARIGCQVPGVWLQVVVSSHVDDMN